MPPELKRYQQSGHLHFVTFSCHDRRPYLSTHDAKKLFEDALERMRIRYDFLVVAYVVMPEHVHVVLNPLEEVYSMAAINKAIKSPAATDAFEMYPHLREECRVGESIQLLAPMPHIPRPS